VAKNAKRPLRTSQWKNTPGTIQKGLVSSTIRNLNLGFTYGDGNKELAGELVNGELSMFHFKAYVSTDQRPPPYSLPLITFWILMTQ
jgi:hypothetical protein